jgi:hypothetical protein
VINAGSFYDGATLTILRCALDDVLIDQRFLESRSVPALEIAEHILAQAARGERDLQRIKTSTLAYLVNRSERSVAWGWSPLLAGRTRCLGFSIGTTFKPCHRQRTNPALKK